MKNMNRVNILWFLVKMMNKQWIEASYIIGDIHRIEHGIITKVSYLDILGLFESSWMIFEYTNRDHEIEFGYPR